MAYRIVYGGEIPAARKKSGNLGRLRIFTAAFLLIFALGVRQHWPEGTRVLRDWLLPGQSSREDIFGDFISEVREGVPVDEALAVFCRTLIQNGKTD